MAEGEQIEQQLQLFLDLINQSDDGIFVVDPDSSLFLYCNDKARNRLGYAPEELLTMGVVDIEEILPALFSWHEHVKEVRKKGHVLIEGRHRRKDGSTFPVEMNVRLASVGGRDFMIAICRDVTERKRIAETLSGKTRLIEAFFRYNINPIAFLDRQFNFIRVNEAYAAAGQRDVSEFPGHNHFEFYPSDARAIFEQVVATKEPHQTFARPFSYPDHPEWGVTYWDWTLTPILTDTGEVEFLVLSLKDVTKRKRSEEALQESEAKYRALVDNSLVGVFKSNLKGDFLYANNALAKIFEFDSAEKLISCGVPIMYENPEDRKALIETIIKTGSLDNYEVKMHTKTGKVKYMLICATLEKDVLSGMAVDITERKLAEKALLESRALLRSVIDSSTSLIYLVDIQGRFLFINRKIESRLGIASDQLCGKKREAILPKEIAQQHRENDLKVIRSGEQISFEEENHEQDGKHVYFSVKFPVFDENGNIFAVGGISTDITERKRAEDEIRKYQKNLRYLAQRISLIEEQERKCISEALHDNISQNLAFSKIKLNVLRDSASAGDIAGELDDIQELIEQSLQFTRSLTAELSPPILFDLGFEKAVEWLCERTSEKHHVMVELLSDGKLKEVKIEMSILLFKTVRELLINIVKHARAKKALVSLRRENEDTLRINVEDDGVGFNISKPGHYEGGAESFGLFNIRERLNYLGGTFDIESEPGHGTRVTMVVPMNMSVNKGTAK